MNNKSLLIGVVFFIIFLVLILQPQKPLILDDVTSTKFCPNLIEKADIIYVIPLYNNVPLDPEWCQEMRTLNKTFGLHGITHTYHEFLKPVNKEDLQKAIHVFEECFNQTPSLFRPPYNKISEENKQLIKEFDLILYQKPYYQHPYCHCQPAFWMIPLNWLNC